MKQQINVDIAPIAWYATLMQVSCVGVRAFFCAAITHLQCKLPLQNNMLQDLGCLHPKQLERRRTQSAIQKVARKLQPEIDVSLVSGEWKALQSDSDLDSIDKEQRIEHYWNDVFAFKVLLSPLL